MSIQSSVSRVLDRSIGRSLFDEYRYSDHSLGLFRIILGGYFMLMQMPPLLTEISALPDSLYLAPIGMMQLFSGFPPAWVMVLLYVLGLLFASALVLGLRVRVAGVGLTLTMLVVYGFKYSLGKVDGSLPILVTPAFFAFSGWERAFSLNQKPVREGDHNRLILAYWAWILGILLLTAGLPKLVGGWADVTTQATRQYYFHALFEGQREMFLQPAMQKLEARWLWEAFDWFTLLLELSFLALPMRQRWMQWGLALMILLHIGILMIMNVPSASYPVIYLGFFALDEPARWLSERTTNLRWHEWQWQKKVALLIGVAALGFGLSSLLRVGFEAIATMWGTTVVALVPAFFVESIAAILAVRWMYRQLRKH